MPVTPFHFGPGLLVKAAARRHFSFASFAITQVVIDVETVYHILRHEWPLHRALHTLLIGTPVGLVVGALWFVVSRRVARSRGRVGDTLSRWHESGLVAALVGGGVGGASHSILDAIMHPDVQPCWPWIAGNPLLGLVGVTTLYASCAVAGIVAVGILLATRRSESRG